MLPSLFLSGLWRLQTDAGRRQTFAFAPGTRRNHSSHLRLFLSFTIYYALPSLPTTVHVLLLFIEFLSRSYKAPKAVVNVVASLRFHHERLGLDALPFDHIKVRLALRSLRFTLRTPPNPTPGFPARLLRPLYNAAASLGRWALAFRALVVFAFFSFARLGSLLPVRASPFDTSRFPTVGDVSVGQGRAALHIKFSKTRQGADGGFWAPFLPADTLPCPVRTARMVLDRARREGWHSLAPLFAADSVRGRPPLPMLQGQARGFLRHCLTIMGLPARSYTFHSFRRGGCSFAYMQGAVEADLALHGDWSSEAVRSYYPADAARMRVASLLAGSRGSPP